jgi:hypothetical protein
MENERKIDEEIENMETKIFKWFGVRYLRPPLGKA